MAATIPNLMNMLDIPVPLRQFEAIYQNREYNPHHLLGLHERGDGQKAIYLWRPGAETIYLEVQGEIVEATKILNEGIFEYIVPPEVTYKDYRVYYTDGSLNHDPYAFIPTIGDLDQYLFAKGVHYKLYEAMGGRLTTHQGIEGAKFALWAPSAKRVSLVGDFNHWDGRITPMRTMGQSGIWEIFVPGLKEGSKYKFEILTSDHQLKIKSDPFALSSELRPSTASKIANIDRFEWQDQEWLEYRSKHYYTNRPLNAYEVHLGSWRKKGEAFLNYRELAIQLADYCKEMGFTHVELMPVQEHPLDESWGYQVSGFYAVTSRFGTPEDFQWFVNHLHKNHIGVILDWVPGHFPTDDFSLARFDGTCLYEHEDPRQGFHPHWNTLIFNYGRHEVSNFLIANALFWFEKMHVDGLRVDAVASMLYLDYGRDHGEWIPNQYGGNENLEAIEFIKHLNSIVHQHHSNILMIAEESTAFAGVTTPVQYGGLGFDLKWNMGWMNDTLRYFSKDMIYRHYHHNDLTFGLLYAFTEKFICVLSHDEVVHGKQSLISKMPGDLWQKFANVRLLYSYMLCQPGKNLLFMGGEIGQWNEWYCKAEIEWFLLKFPYHHGLQTMVKDLNHLYLTTPSFWEKDFDYTGFEWVDFSDSKNSVVSYLRKSSSAQILCVHNFTPTFFPEYVLPLHNARMVQEIFNSDGDKYGGSGKTNWQPGILHSPDGHPIGVKIQLAPLATMIFRVEF